MNHFENNLLFNDWYLLENQLGTDTLKVSSVNTNCDCDGYSYDLTDDDHDSNSFPPSAVTTS